MGRWEPGARERLQLAALELFIENGFEATTVAEIARRAELTERTFYRHFSDKREVIFDGQDLLVDAFVAGVVGGPEGASPRDLAEAAVAASGSFFTDERRPWSRRRQAAIDSDTGLRERESLKMGVLARALTAALRDRGVGDPTAELAADAAISVFRVSFAQWIAADETRSIDEIQASLFAAQRALA
ncbi:TetR family transcriptional regulator [Schumannella luteola]|uniref:AcrR family transcriptional regulator n=1 Tax=Schumannella luteola TaxID=472059 RepID=A0A852Y8V1_9MICO|nr:TetR/AcrR family transcriptional regulator [Schumannella luteola]NYG99386.1 AcrR family transcriptional regulator [Schumannella luteola]TPX06112.1 TetR family transcriptional regulator [Schumannella luteola]